LYSIVLYCLFRSFVQIVYHEKSSFEGKTMFYSKTTIFTWLGMGEVISPSTSNWTRTEF